MIREQQLELFKIKITKINGLIYTEKRIVDALCRNHEKKNNMVFPNVFIGAYEADVVALTKAGYTTKYEVKISRPDFQQDFKKVEKHLSLKQGDRTNYFYYVVPPDLIQPHEVPEHAGLIYIEIRKYGSYYVPSIRHVKVCKKLSKNPCTPDFERKLLLSTYYRFHQLRKNNGKQH